MRTVAGSWESPGPRVRRSVDQRWLARVVVVSSCVSTWEDGMATREMKSEATPPKARAMAVAMERRPSRQGAQPTVTGNPNRLLREAACVSPAVSGTPV